MSSFHALTFACLAYRFIFRSSLVDHGGSVGCIVNVMTSICVIIVERFGGCQEEILKKLIEREVQGNLESKLRGCKGVTPS